jgi:hypothetical protein
MSVHGVIARKVDDLIFRKQKKNHRTQDLSQAPRPPASAGK